MSETLTLDEIVALMENTLDDAAGLDLHPVFVSGLSALIADWRKRGEALAPFAQVGEAIDFSKFGQVLFGDADRAFRESECGCRWMVDGNSHELTWLDFRRARAAITPQQPPAKP